MKIAYFKTIILTLLSVGLFVPSFALSEEIIWQGNSNDTPQLKLIPNDANTATDNPQAIFLEKISNSGHQMVKIPQGSMMMGFTKEEMRWGRKHGAKKKWQKRALPRHRVNINYDFAMAAHEVTVGQFKEFVDDTGYNTGSKCLIYDKKWQEKRGINWRKTNFDQDDTHPVTCIHWNDAQAYIKWLNNKLELSGVHKYRLPSEAEWEYAARANSETQFYWSNDDELTNGCAYANINDGKADYWINGKHNFNCKDGYQYTAPVGSFLPNNFGLYDMSGNVWEWVADCWNKNYKRAPKDGSAWQSGDCKRRVLRGGSWYSDANIARLSNRNRDKISNTRSSSDGFRLAITLP